MKTFLFAMLLGTAALVSPAVSTASAAEATAPQSLGHHHYDVYYRTCFHGPWRLYGSYDCRDEAEHAAYHLHHDHGYRTKIRCHR